MMKKLLLSVCLVLSVTLVAQTQPKDSVSNWNIKGHLNLLFNQSSFSNWVAGGEDAVATGITVNYDINYRSGNWKWDNKIIAAYGSSFTSKNGLRKTNDRFDYNSVLAYKSSGNWHASFLTRFVTQFANGFNYEKSPYELVSQSFAPAYLSFGPGFLWRKSDNIRINIAPATSQFTFVNSMFSGQYGVPQGETSLYELGFNLSAFLKFELMKNVTMENIINIYSDYLKNPENIDVNYQINFSATINKYLSTNLTMHMIIDDNASKNVQFREVFGIGVNYIFHKR